MSWGDSDLGRGADEKLYRVADAASWVPSIPCWRRDFLFRVHTVDVLRSLVMFPDLRGWIAGTEY